MSRTSDARGSWSVGRLEAAAAAEAAWCSSLGKAFKVTEGAKVLDQEVEMFQSTDLGRAGHTAMDGATDGSRVK